jgi:hypothetical protein
MDALLPALLSKERTGGVFLWEAESEMADAPRDKYTLEIYESGSADNVTATFKSDSPFQSVEVGHLMNLTVAGGQLLLVTKVEHILWEAGGVVKHKVCVFTKAVPDTAASRRQGS